MASYKSMPVGPIAATPASGLTSGGSWQSLLPKAGPPKQIVSPKVALASPQGSNNETLKNSFNF